MSSTPEYDEFLARYKTRYPEKASKDPKGLMATKLDRIKELRNRLVNKKVSDENRDQINEDLFAISILNAEVIRDYKRYKNTDTAKARASVQLYENAGIKKVDLWGGSKSAFKSKILDELPIALTNLLDTKKSPKVNKFFTGMTDPVSPPTLSTEVSTGSTETMLGSPPPTSLETIKEEEEEKEAPKDIVEGDEGVVSVKTEAEIPATIDDDAIYVSEDIKKLAEETLDVLEVPTGAPEEKKEEEPPAPPPLPTATEDATPLTTETTETTETPLTAEPTTTDEPPVETVEPPVETGGQQEGGSEFTTITGGQQPTQEFEVEAGTRTQPTLDGILGSIDRGVLSSISKSRREGLSINKLKADIKDYHKIYNNVIPAFKNRAHQKRKQQALKSKNKKEVLQHYEEMESLIANYYKNDGGFKLGVIISAESLFSGNIFGGSDLYATGMVGASVGGATPINRNSLERGGTTKYEKVVDIEPTYTRGGIDHALQKPVQNKEPKAKKGRVRFDKNISTIPVAVHRPYNHILNRPLKPSYNIKIKGKKK